MSIVSKIIPSIIQCFALIFFGFVCGLIKLIDTKQATGIGLYVSKFALPCLLFNAMFSIDVSHVNWSLIAAIAIAKIVLYFSVFIFCSLIIRPRNFGIASIVSLFCTQTNDFSIFLPVLKSMFPELTVYVYLLSPVQMIIPCTFSYFFLEWEFSKKSTSSQDFENSTTTQKVCSVLLRIFANPLFFMTSLGIFFNILLKDYFPEILFNIMKIVADSFPSTALFFLGFSMIGKVSNLRSTSILSLTCLVIVKLIISPFLMRQFTNYILSFCNLPEVKPMVTNFTTFAFLYGTSPTSPAVFLYAYEFDVMSDIVSTGVVLTTCLFGPVIIVYAAVVLFHNSSNVENYETEVKPTMNWISVISTIGLIWTLIKVWRNDKAKYHHIKWALNFLCIYLLMMCFGNLFAQIRITKSVDYYVKIFSFFLIFVGMLGTRVWNVFLVVLKYLQLEQQITRHLNYPISKINLMLIFLGVVSPLMTGIVVFAIKPDKTTGVTNPFYFYGIHQEIVVLVWLILCLIGSLIFLLNLIKLRLKEFYNIRNNKENNSANTNKITASEIFTLNPLISSENQKNIAAINRYLCFFIYTIISLFLSCSLASWRLINDAQLGVFVILEFLDSILIYGQGIFIFLIFGPQVGVFLIPMKEKISAAYRSFKAKYIPRRRKFRVDETEFEDPSELYLSKIHNEMSPVDFFKAFHLKHAIRNLSHNWSFQSNDDINFQGFTEANFIEWFVLFMSIQDKIPRSYLVPFNIKVEMDTHETLAKIGKCLFDELILNDEFNMNTDFSEKINIYSFKEKNVQL